MYLSSAEMEKIGNTNYYSFDEVLDEQVGKRGTPERDDFDSRVEKAVNAYRLGEIIKGTRTEKGMTQDEMGLRMGVKKAQVSRLEKGRSMTIPTMYRAFKALDVKTAVLELDGVRIRLW